jgi:NTE family protein
MEQKKVNRNMNIGISLGAGSARGWAHIGVLRALDAAGLRPARVCGTSIGALVGAAYADGDLDALERWVTQLTWRKVLGFFDISFGGGLLKGAKLIQFLRDNFLDRDIERLALSFGAVATDLASGREVWLREGSVVDAVRASIALPGLFTPCERDGWLLVDGALVNPVPVSLARAMGADFVIAVDLSSDMAGRHVARSGARHRGGSPGVVEVVIDSLNIMSVRITRSRLAGEPADVVITPRLGRLGLLDYHRAAEAIAEGREATEVLIPQIRRLLADAG